MQQTQDSYHTLSSSGGRNGAVPSVSGQAQSDSGHVARSHAMPDTGYMAKRLMLSEQLRRALWAAGESLYRVSKETGVPYTTLHRFAAAGGSIRLGNADKLAAYLGARLVIDKQGRR